MPPQAPARSARPVAGGEIRVVSPEGGPATRPPILYEVWAAPPADEAPGDAWVELYLDPDGPPVRLEASTISLLDARLDAHTTLETLREAGVGVSGGSLSMTLRQEWPLAASFAVLAVSLAFVAALFVAVRGRRRASLFRTVARHEAASREAERGRVAREIHDGPLQDVAALARTEAADPALQRSLRSVSADLRALAAGLRPPALDEFGLGPALDDLAERWALAPRPLTVRVTTRSGGGLDSDDDLGSAPAINTRPAPEVELAVYRVTQEALTNAASHGHARTAWVFLDHRDGSLDLTIRDDGRGLNQVLRLDRPGVDKLVADGHFGVVGMVERAHSVGGRLHIGPGPGGLGTEVRLSVPTRR